MTRMKRSFIFIILLVFTLLVGSCAHNSPVLSNCSATEMYSNALTLYADGDVDNATYQMALYLEMKQTDGDAMRLLADWYDELGKKSYAEK